MRLVRRLSRAVAKAFAHSCWGFLALLVAAGLMALLLFADAARRESGRAGSWLQYVCSKDPTDSRLAADPLIYLPLRRWLESKMDYRFQPQLARLKRPVPWPLLWALETGYVYGFLLAAWLLAGMIWPPYRLTRRAKRSLAIGSFWIFVFLDFLPHLALWSRDGVYHALRSVVGWPLILSRGRLTFYMLGSLNLGALAVDALLLGLFMVPVANIMSRFSALRAHDGATAAGSHGSPDAAATRSLVTVWTIVFAFVFVATAAWHWWRYIRVEAAYRAGAERREVTWYQGPTLAIEERALRWVKVLSGDSILLADGQVLHLAGVEAPEGDSPEAVLSRSALEYRMRGCDVLARGPRTPAAAADNVFEAEAFILPPRKRESGLVWPLRTIPYWERLTFECVNSGSCWLRKDGPADLLDEQTHAMAGGWGIWKDAEFLRAHVDAKALAEEALRQRNAFGFFGEDVGVILSRLGNPQSVASLRALWDMSGRRNMRYVALLVRVGDRGPLDEVVESLIAPSDAYPVEQRANRLDALRRILPVALPERWKWRSDIYNQVYRWYQAVRDDLRADDQGYRLTLGRDEHRPLPVLEGPAEPVLQLASGKTVPIQEKWAAYIDELCLSNPVLRANALYQVGQSGGVYQIDLETGIRKAVYSGPGDASYRIDLETGTTKVVYGGPADAHPAYNEAGEVAFWGDVMLFASTTGRLIGVDTRTWQPMWERAGSLHDHSAIGVCGAMFVLETHEGTLEAVRPLDGTSAWSFPLGPPSRRHGPDRRDPPFIAPELISDVIVVCRRNKVLFLDPASGRLVREADHSFALVSSEPVFWDGQLYLTDDAKEVVALSLDTGKLLWKAPMVPARWRLNVVLCALPEGVLATERDGIRLLSHRDGQTLWQDSFWHSRGQPTATASDEFIFCLVSEDESGRYKDPTDESCVLVVYRRRDRTRVGEWRVGNDETEVIRPLAARGDEVYVGEKVHCIKVYDRQ